MTCIAVIFHGNEDCPELMERLIRCGNVFLFHSMDREIFADMPQSQLTEQIEKAEETMEKIKDKLRMKGIRVSVDSGWGDVEERVKALSELTEADKIFLVSNKTIYSKRFIDKLNGLKGFEVISPSQPLE